MHRPAARVARELAVVGGAYEFDVPQFVSSSLGNRRARSMDGLIKDEQMLKVIIELWPGGREAGRRVIATADIGRVKDGQLADYEVELQEKLLEHIGVGEIAHVREYPRWSASVWDLVGRCIAAALNGGKEELPPRPVLPEVPVHTSADGTPYVRMREIPEPARALFAKNMSSSTCPLIKEDEEPRGCVYAWDWQAFLEGRR